MHRRSLVAGIAIVLVTMIATSRPGVAPMHASATPHIHTSDNIASHATATSDLNGAIKVRNRTVRDPEVRRGIYPVEPLPESKDPSAYLGMTSSGSLGTRLMFAAPPRTSTPRTSTTRGATSRKSVGNVQQPPLPLTAEPEMPSFNGQFYVIHSSLTPDRVREADLRMSKMAAEYRSRTRDFAGEIRSKFPFYLYPNEETYLAGGGLSGTAGCFNPNLNELMAFDATDAELWHTVQHEGFHQFASAVIRGELPIWLNEGLAEYFGEAVFTGDGFVTGVIPDWRRDRIAKTFAGKRDDKFKPIEDLLHLDHETWNDEMSLTNYDQAWSIVQFLVHADGGKYQTPFAAFIRSLSTGQQWEAAWKASIGSFDGFEDRWKSYWQQLPENPTEDLYVNANVRTLTNFLARATAQKQTFESFGAFVKSADVDEVRTGDKDWLPPGVLKFGLHDTARLMKNGYTFSITTPSAGSKLPTLVCVTPDSTQVVGRFAMRNSVVSDVTVTSRRASNSSPTSARVKSSTR